MLLSRRRTLGLLVKAVAAHIRSHLPDAFSVDTAAAAAASRGALADEEAEPEAPRLRLHAERIATAVDKEAAVEALERAHALYVEYAVFQDGGDWEDVVAPALEVTHI